MNKGILGNARARGVDPSRPIATRAEAYAGTDRGLVITPETMHLSRRGTGRAWFWELFNDFAMTASGQNAGSDGCLFFDQSSGGTSNLSTFNAKFDNFPGRVGAGLLGLATGATSTGRGGFDSTLAIATHRYDTGTTFFESLVYVPTLADATDDYVFRIGYCYGSGIQNEQMGIEYNRSNSANWVGLCSKIGVHTRFDTGVPVEAAKWVRLRMQWNDATALVQVNDYAPVGGSTADIRTDGASRIGGHIIKTAGTTSRMVVIDYIYCRHDFNQERTYT